VGYLWTDDDTELVGSQGYYIEVYDDYVLVRGRDFVNKEWVSNAQFMLNPKNIEDTVNTDIQEIPESNILPVIIIAAAVIIVSAVVIIIVNKKKYNK
jgi:hypothetical protein